MAVLLTQTHLSPLLCIVTGCCWVDLTIVGKVRFVDIVFIDVKKGPEFPKELKQINMH